MLTRSGLALVFPFPDNKVQHFCHQGRHHRLVHKETLDGGVLCSWCGRFYCDTHLRKEYKITKADCPADWNCPWCTRDCTCSRCIRPCLPRQPRPQREPKYKELQAELEQHKLLIAELQSRLAQAERKGNDEDEEHVMIDGRGGTGRGRDGGIRGRGCGPSRQVVASPKKVNRFSYFMSLYLFPSKWMFKLLVLF
ncbi:hypothetical protein Tco_0109877 [Tanacetum coccineum]